MKKIFQIGSKALDYAVSVVYTSIIQDFKQRKEVKQC